MSEDSKLVRGRVYHIRKHGAITFITLSVNGALVNLRLEKNKLAEYQVHYPNLSRGVLLVLLQFEKSLDNAGTQILVVLKLRIQGYTRNFPKEFPKNQIKNKEVKYKNKILDCISNLKSFDNLKKRYDLIQLVRYYFTSLNSTEVDIPILEESFGGAFAKPFETKCQYNSKKYYLRVSHEFPLKRLLIAGFENVYCIGPCFRNESLDSTHSFEYLHLEHYHVHSTVRNAQKLIEKLYLLCYQHVNNSVISHDFDLSTDWPTYDKKDIAELLKKHNLNHLDQLMERKLLGPYYHLQGLESNPLAKNPHSFDTMIDFDLELATGYQEENDAEKIVEHSTYKEILDKKFLHDLNYGLFETVGLGIGLDRLIKSVLKSDCLREIQTFPHI